MKQIIKQPLLSDLSELRATLDRIFGLSWSDPGNWLSNVGASNWIPTIDIRDDINQYVIRVDVPGVDPKNIDITIDKGVLTIKGHKKTETKEERENYIHVERSQGSFYRSFDLLNAADSSKISAKSKNGVLEIIVPKIKESTSHKIQVKEE